MQLAQNHAMPHFMAFKSIVLANVALKAALPGFPSQFCFFACGFGKNFLCKKKLCKINIAKYCVS
jgi:hypothetical protein